MTSTKSAIRECRDQLFLDRSVGNYLSRVGSNLSMDRPQLGYHNDSLWRAVVRRGAVDYLQIANLFRDWLDVVFGPRVTVTSVLSQTTAAYDEFLMIADPKRLPQRGTVVVNEGLVTEQTWLYTFIDPLTGKMDLSGVLSDVIDPDSNNAFGTLLSDALIGATSLQLLLSQAAAFPTSGFPKTLLLDAGTASEEVVTLTGHATPDSALTVSALTKDHFGPTSSPVTTRFKRSEEGGQVIFVVDSSSFPKEGLIKIIDNGFGSTETVEFYNNDPENGILYLRTAITNSYTTLTTPVTLMRTGCTVQLAQLQVKGVGWEVFQTEPRKIQIYIPKSIVEDRLIDASFLHGDFSSIPASSLAANASIGDSLVMVNNGQDFPVAGSVIIGIGFGSEEKRSYWRIGDFDTRISARPVRATGTLTVVAPGLISDGETFTLNDGLNPPRVFEYDKTGAWTPANVRVNIATAVTVQDVRDATLLAINTASSLDMSSTVLTVSQLSLRNYHYGTTGNQTQSDTVADLGFILTNMTGGVDGIPVGTSTLYVDSAMTIWEARYMTKQLLIGRGTGTPEVVIWSSIDLQHNTIQLASPTTLLHNDLDFCEVYPKNQFNLNVPLSNAHLALDGVQLVHDQYPATDLELGDPTVAPTSDDTRYRGHYVYYPGNSARRNNIASANLSEHLAGPVGLIVDAVSGYTSLEVPDAALFESTGAFSVTIGRKRGSTESVETSGAAVLGTTMVTLPAVAVPIGSTSVALSLGDGLLFPKPSGGAPYGYRLDVNNVTGRSLIGVREVIGDTIYFETPTTVGYVGGETIRLKSDVILLSAPLANKHLGKIPYTNRLSLTPGSLLSPDKVHLVEELRTYITVTSITDMPTVLGTVIFNFGTGSTPVEGRTKVTLTAGGVNADLDDTSRFPTGDFMIVIGSGSKRERRHVSSNNVGLNRLILSSGADYTHEKWTQVQFDPGDQTEVSYDATVTLVGPINRLVFNEGVYLPAHFQKNLPVVAKAKESEPSDYGTDYPLILWGGWDTQLRFLLDWGRAAGVQVVVITDK